MMSIFVIDPTTWEENLKAQSPLAGGADHRAQTSLDSLLDAVRPWSWLALRVGTGALLVPHGLQKLFGMFGGGGLSGTAEFLGSVGYPAPAFMALLLGCVEVFGGILLATGFLTRAAALSVVGFMFFAVLFHLPNGFFWTAKGFEYPVLWGLAALFFAVNGGGAFSVDRALGRKL